MGDETDHRSAVDRRHIGVEHGQPVPVEQRFDRGEVVVQQMLVINLVEGQVLHDLLHIQELHDEHAVVRQALANAVGNRVQFLKVKEHAGGVDHVELPVQALDQFEVEELIQRRHARFIRDLRGAFRRFDPQHVVAQGLEMLELRTVVRADIQHGPRLLARIGETLIDLGGDLTEVFAQRPRHAGEVRVVAEHNFLLDRVVQLHGRTLAAIHHAQRIHRLGADFFFPQEVVAPRLRP